MIVKITTNEKQYRGTSEDYTEMLRRIPTYPGIARWGSETKGDGKGYHTTIQFEFPEAAGMFLAFEDTTNFTKYT